MGGTASEEGGKQERTGGTGGKWRTTLLGVIEQGHGSLHVMAGWLCLRGLRPVPVQDTRGWLTL